MPRVAVESEREYVAARLRPVLDQLRDDRDLRDEFIQFALARGGDVTLVVQRLQKTRWQSRTPQFVHFFVLVLAEFGFEKGLLKPNRVGRRRR